jgi:hypothetical protein
MIRKIIFSRILMACLSLVSQAFDSYTNIAGSDIYLFSSLYAGGIYLHFGGGSGYPDLTIFKIETLLGFTT